MKTWRVLLGPFLIWAAHFLAVYGLASLADVSSTGAAWSFRIVGLIGTALCGAALAVQYLRSRKASGEDPLSANLASLGFATALIAIAWQSLPLVISG